MTHTAVAAALESLEALLREEQDVAHLTAVVGSLSTAVALVRIDASRGWVNPAAAGLLALEPGEVTAAALTASLERLRARAGESGSAGLITDPLEVLTDCLWEFTGSPSHLRVTSFPIGEGPPRARVWVFDDVSVEMQLREREREVSARLAEAEVRQEEALRNVAESESLLRAAMDGMLDPHALIESVRDDRGEVVDFTILLVNQAALDYWSLPGETVIGKRMLDLLPGVAETGLIRFYAGVLESGVAGAMNDWGYCNEVRGDFAFYDLRAARAPGDRLSISWADVTERHRAVLALDEQRRRFQLLAENASDVVFRSDNDGVLEWVSPSVTRLLGWRPYDLIGGRIAELAHGDDRSRLADALRQQDAASTQHIEVRLASAEGAWRWFDVTVKVVVDEAGRPIARMGTWRDIGGEMAARQELRAEHARFEAVKDSATDAFVTVGEHGKIVAWSPAAVRMFGYRPEEAIGQPFSLIVPHGQRETLARWLTDLTAPEVVEAVGRIHFSQLTRRDGARIACEYSLAVWERSGQQHITAILRDVTQQRAVLDALWASREELAEAQRLANAGSWTFEPASGLVRWSDELTRIYGLPMSEDRSALNRLLDPVSAEQRGELLHAVQAAAEGDVTELEYDLAHPGGDVRRVRARVAPAYDERGRRVRVRGAAIDVTEAHQAAEAKARRVARHADYLARVGHTLRTHLSVVEGWAGILESAFDQLDPATRAGAIGAIRRNAAALVGHVQGLMSESAEHAKADALVAEAVDVAAITTSVVSDYRGLAGSRELRVSPSHGVMAWGSAEACDTVIRHLIENALRHTDEDGTVEVLIDRGARGVSVTVRDDGPGICPGVRLFTAFSKSSRSSGHGLGLHVVQTLVEAMGGAVEGRNRGSGRGAEFVVTLRGVPD